MSQHLHLREAMALPARIAQYLKRSQSRKTGKVSRKKHQAVANHTISSTNPNSRKRSSEEITDATRDVSLDRFIDADAAPPQKRPRWPVVDQGRDEFRPSRPRKRSSDESDEASSDASSDRFVDADAPPPQKRPRWPAGEDDGECEFNPFTDKKSGLLAEEVPDATAHGDREPFDHEELTSPVQRFRSLAEEIADATTHEDGEAFDDEVDEVPSTARSRSLVEELADALISENGDGSDEDEETMSESLKRRSLAHELADATADEDGNPFEDEELIGMTIAVRLMITYILRRPRSLAEELAEAIPREDIEPFDDPDEPLSELPELTDDDDKNSRVDGGSLGEHYDLPTEEESPSLDYRANEEGNPLGEADADLHLRFYSLEEQIADTMSRHIGQELNGIDSASRMCLDAPANKRLNSIANEVEDIIDIKDDAAFITALEALDENDFSIEDADAPFLERRRSLADEIADATVGEEGDPFDVEEDSPADNMTSESSAEVRKRPFWLWTSTWSIPKFHVDSLF